MTKKDLEFITLFAEMNNLLDEDFTVVGAIVKNYLDINEATLCSKEQLMEAAFENPKILVLEEKAIQYYKNTSIEKWNEGYKEFCLKLHKEIDKRNGENN